MNTRPCFIVFEGIDGAGKSTQCARLYEHIRSMNIPAVKLVEPTDGPWGRAIRQALRSGRDISREEQLELFIKDRADDYNLNIRPALENGITIVMDRYFYSNAAYQGMEGLAPSEIIEMNLSRGFPLPHRVYFVDLPAHAAMERVRSRNGPDTELFEKESFLDRVRENFLSVADGRFLMLDGMMSEEEIFKLVKDDYLKSFTI